MPRITKFFTSTLMLSTLIFAPAAATDGGDEERAPGFLDGWEDIGSETDAPSAANQAAADPDQEPRPQRPRPNVSLTREEMEQLTAQEFRDYNNLCKFQIDNYVDHWEPSKQRWYEGSDKAYYKSCPSLVDVARRIQRQHQEGGNGLLRWEHAMRVATQVFDILSSYDKERVFQENLEHTHLCWNAASWATLGFGEIGRKVKDDEWWGNVHPTIVTRRLALVGNHAFRNALEVFLHLRDQGKSLEDIKAKYPEVYAALSGAIDPTELQLNELKHYDRTRSG